MKKLTNGKGADYVFVTVGSAEAAEQNFSLIRRQGTSVFMGIASMTSVRAMPPMYQLVANELRILTCQMGSIRLSVDALWLIELSQQERLKLDEIITGRYPLKKINEAIENMDCGKALKNVIMFGQ